MLGVPQGQVRQRQEPAALVRRVGAAGAVLAALPVAPGVSLVPVVGENGRDEQRQRAEAEAQAERPRSRAAHGLPPGRPSPGTQRPSTDARPAFRASAHGVARDSKGVQKEPLVSTRSPNQATDWIDGGAYPAFIVRSPRVGRSTQKKAQELAAPLGRHQREQEQLVSGDAPEQEKRAKPTCPPGED